jgi:hypothetical protein
MKPIFLGVMFSLILAGFVLAADDPNIAKKDKEKIQAEMQEYTRSMARKNQSPGGHPQS